MKVSIIYNNQQTLTACSCYISTDCLFINILIFLKIYIFRLTNLDQYTDLTIRYQDFYADFKILNFFEKFEKSQKILDFLDKIWKKIDVFLTFFELKFSIFRPKMNIKYFQIFTVRDLVIIFDLNFENLLLNGLIQSLFLVFQRLIVVGETSGLQTERPTIGFLILIRDRAFTRITSLPM